MSNSKWVEVNFLLSLVMAPKDVYFKIFKIKPLKSSAMTESHLSNLGFIKGAVIKVVNENDGNLIVSIKDSRVAIGKDIAKKIIVEEMWRLTLRDAEVGKYYIIKKIKGKGPLKRRIMDMGITKNSEIYITKVAPLGDPVQINIRNYELSIRKEDAELIEIEEIEK